MWSLRVALNDLGKTYDLPDAFDAAAGIRTLFPAGLANISISLLERYRYSRSGILETHTLRANFSLLADGAGHWKYVVSVAPASSSPSDYYAVGFVFRFSPDNTGHGHMVIGSGVPDESSNVKAAVATVIGFDTWITDNWPDIFANDCEFYLGAADSEVDLYSAGSDMAAKAGFSDLAMLAGAKVTFSDVSVPKGPPGPPDPDSPDDDSNDDPWDDSGDE